MLEVEKEVQSDESSDDDASVELVKGSMSREGKDMALDITLNIKLELVAVAVADEDVVCVVVIVSPE